MKRIVQAISAVLISCVLGSALAANAKLSAVEKASLQAGMQQYIDRGMVDGAFLNLDPATGVVKPLYPATAHPMILKMGQYFVLCSDFRDEKGGAVNVDFYMARRGKSFVVFHLAAAQREQLDKLMKAGKVEMLD